MSSGEMQKWYADTHLYGANAPYMESLYEKWLHDSDTLSEYWQEFFASLPRSGSDNVNSANGANSANAGIDVSHAEVRNEIVQQMHKALSEQGNAGTTADKNMQAGATRRQMHVLRLMNAYRVRGYRKAKFDPLKMHPVEDIPELSLEYHHLNHADLQECFDADFSEPQKSVLSLREIVDRLERTYCGSVGFEFMHIDDEAERSWLLRRIEGRRMFAECGPDECRHLLEQLSAAEGLERYLATSYPGAKRFGLEGGEALIPLLDRLIQCAGTYDVLEVVIGMAHRGRLNVLVNILGKNPAELIREFGGDGDYSGSGDVKYHQGFSSNVLTPGGEIHLALAFNPSHLEIVNAVVAGSVRARQDRRRDFHRLQVLPIMLHGDASFAGQGVVMEIFQMSRTRAHHIGGAVHIIVNNQIGFTTSNRHDARSTDYCSDIAHVVRAPVFHVNADDPEAVVAVAELAFEYRQNFHKDVVIDLVCYRRHGHNEADDPRITQPLMYQKMREYPTVRSLYARRLQDANLISSRESADMEREYRDTLEKGLHVVKSLVREPNPTFFVDWAPYLDRSWHEACDTGVPVEKLREWGELLSTFPEGFQVHAGVRKLLAARQRMTHGEIPLDWGFAENIAYASLLDAGCPVRLSGQDSVRGTFAHRHFALHDQKSGAEYLPLRQFARERNLILTAHDSLLSELGALGFEYGYASTAPDVLTVWEAQFGDFANGAQVVIDQFLSSGELKWGRLCGLVLLLPHGYEGQGPEHSSARLERFLQLCAEENMQVCAPTTPAQIFHLLRRQILRPLRRPLVVMTPKSLLRHPQAVSSLKELAEGCFHPVMRASEVRPEDVRRLILCSGKVYYDLLKKKQERDDTAIIRLEQLYPFPSEELGWELLRYPQITDLIWCQEEPRNQGAWYTTRHRISSVAEAVGIKVALQYVGRPSSASAAAGYARLHHRQQETLVANALGEKAS